MASYKYDAPPGGWNYNKAINEVAVAIGEVPLANLDALTGVLEIVVPDQYSEDLIRQILQGHRPVDTSVVAPRLLFGNADSEISSAGLVTNLSPSVDSYIRNIRGDDITINELTSPATFTGNGTVDCWPAIEVLAGTYAVWFALSNGVVTFYVNSTDGKVYAGVGAVAMDDNGLTFEALDVYTDINSVKWVTSDGLLTPAAIVGFPAGTTPNRSGSVSIDATAELNGQGNAVLSLATNRTNTINSFNMLRINDFYGDTYSPLFPMFQYTDRFGNRGTLHVGDYEEFATYNSDAAEKVVYTRTIEANSLGTKGGFTLSAAGLFFNNAFGAARNARVRVRYGGLAGTLIADSGDISVANNGNLSWTLNLRMSQQSATNAQLSIVTFTHSTATGTSMGSATTLATVNGTSSSFASDVDVVITTDWESASAALIHYLVMPVMLGPYYA